MTYPARPTLPWAVDANYTTESDPYGGTNTKLAPPSGLVSQGVRPKRQLPARYFNYVVNRINASLDWFAQRLTDGIPHALVTGTLAEMQALDSPVDGEIFFATDIGMAYRWNAAGDYILALAPFSYPRGVGSPISGTWELMGQTRFRQSVAVDPAGNPGDPPFAYFTSTTFANIAGAGITIPFVKARDVVRAQFTIGEFNYSNADPLLMPRSGAIRAIYDDGTDHPIPGLADVRFSYSTLPTDVSAAWPSTGLDLRSRPLSGYGCIVAPADATSVHVQLQGAVAAGLGNGWAARRIALDVEVLRHGAS